MLDQSPNLSFEIQKISDNAGDVYESTVLTVMDGTDPVELDITDNGNATFTVKAKAVSVRFSYRLTLAKDTYLTVRLNGSQQTSILKR